MHDRAAPGEMPREDAPPAPGHARPGRKPWLRAAGRVLRALGLASGLAMLALALGFLWFLQAAAAAPEQPDRATDGIVVLTGGADRVRTAVGLLMQGRAGLLLVSGAHRDVGLADLAATAGRPVAALQARVTLGHAARSTRGNAAETAAWARAERLTSIRVVTAGYHMPRALLELRRALPEEVALIAHPVVPSGLRDAGAATRPRTWTLLAGEYLKLIGAVLGLGSAAPPRPDAGQ